MKIEIFVSLLLAFAEGNALENDNEGQLVFVMQQSSSETEENTPSEKEPLAQQQLRDVEIPTFEELFSQDVSVGKASCSCQTNACGCCADLKVKPLKIKTEGCVELSFDSASYKIRVSMTIGGKKVFTGSVPVKNPFPLCFNFASGQICISLSNIQVSPSDVKGCTKLQIELFEKTIANIDFGCFDIPIKKDEGPAISADEVFDWQPLSPAEPIENQPGSESDSQKDSQPGRQTGIKLSALMRSNRWFRRGHFAEEWRAGSKMGIKEEDWQAWGSKDKSGGRVGWEANGGDMWKEV